MNRKFFKFLLIFLVPVVGVLAVMLVGKIDTDWEVKIVGADEFLPFQNNSRIATATTSVALRLEENLPVIHATSTFYPMFAAIVQATYSEDSYKDELQLVSTEQAIDDIKKGRTDVIVATMPSKEQLDSLKNSNLEFVKIAREPLILYNSRDNPVDNLTIDEVTKIYNGSISTWSMLGGKNHPIVAYQLKSGNSSQTCFNSVFNNNRVDDWHRESGEMHDIIIKVAGDEDAIGYAFHSFYTLMCNSEKLKLLKIEGVLPIEENFRKGGKDKENGENEGSYPLLFDVYFIYNRETKNENIVELLDWILLESGGQSVIRGMGYVGVKG